MSLVLVFVQITALGIGAVAAHRAFRRVPTVTLETVHKHFRPMNATALALLGLLFVPISAGVSDRACQLLPLWLQRHNTATMFAVIMVVLPFLSAFAAVRVGVVSTFGCRYETARSLRPEARPEHLLTSLALRSARRRGIS